MEEVRRKTTGLAVAGFCVFFCSFLLFLLPIKAMDTQAVEIMMLMHVSCLACSLVFAGLAIKKIKKYPTRFRGKGLAITTLVLTLLWFSALFIIGVITESRTKKDLARHKESNLAQTRQEVSQRRLIDGEWYSKVRIEDPPGSGRYREGWGSEKTFRLPPPSPSPSRTPTTVAKTKAGKTQKAGGTTDTAVTKTKAEKGRDMADFFKVLSGVILLGADIATKGKASREHPELYTIFYNQTGQQNKLESYYVPRESQGGGLDALVADLSRVSGLPVQLFIIDDSTPNAYSYAGRNMISITTGMLNTGLSKGELAFVLAHEVGHLVAHQYGYNEQFIKAHMNSDPYHSYYLSEEQHRLQHSQLREFLADQLGVWYITRLGYRPADATAFFGRIMYIYGTTSPNERLWGGYTSTHPYTEDRIENIRKWANQN